MKLPILLRPQGFRACFVQPRIIDDCVMKGWIFQTVCLDRDSDTLSVHCEPTRSANCGVQSEALESTLDSWMPGIEESVLFGSLVLHELTPLHLLGWPVVLYCFKLFFFNRRPSLHIPRAKCLTWWLFVSVTQMSFLHCCYEVLIWRVGHVTFCS